MKFKREYFFCSPRLLSNIAEISEIETVIGNIAWTNHFCLEVNGKIYEHQSGCNKALSMRFGNLGWTLQPKLCDSPCLLKRTAGRTEYGHHISISGQQKILSSLRKPIRKNVYVWIEAPSDSVECIKTGECFCSLGPSPLQPDVWQRFCPLLLGHRA